MELKELYLKYGQSIWLDYIRRQMFTSGELRRLVEEHGLRGVTSNPTIFTKAIAEGREYESTIRSFALSSSISAIDIYERLVIEDIQSAADVLRPVYDASHRTDGYVSLEVSPHLAHEAAGTMLEAHRLWRVVNRDNLMIKVPATSEGIVAMPQLIGDGINVNVTLLFSRTTCRQVFDAYMDGLELLDTRGGDLSRVTSVASVFVSRIDAAIDPLLEAELNEHEAKHALGDLVGKAAIANAKLIYQDWQSSSQSPRWRAYARRGAQVQRLLWASTATKDQRMSDVVYVEALIGPQTINTLPPATLEAFREHGHASHALERANDDSAQIVAALAEAGISLEEIADRLREEGIRSFSKSYDDIMTTIERKRSGPLDPALDRTTYHLPASLQAAVHVSLDDWRLNGKLRRLWARDPALWTNRDEAHWLDWLGVAREGQPLVDASVSEFVSSIRGEFDYAVVLGMGGSSLCPEVLARTFGKAVGFPELLVLDSTDPEQVGTLERRISIDRTLFIVSSKSGTTIEPNILADYFYERVCAALGEAKGGEHFIAITDPDSALQRVAERRHYRRVIPGIPGIGGRYSALSNFGMVPAAIMGVDMGDFNERVERMVRACAASVPPEQNPGIVLGLTLGALAARGRDKLTVFASPAIAEIGAWLEQLVAESTGKEGRGIVPIDRERPGQPTSYSEDRLFVYLRLERNPDPAQDAAIELLKQSEHPVITIAVADARDLGQEFFRWEFATAVAGSVLGIHPFDQPDVEASKVEARKLTSAYEATGSLPDEQPFYQGEGVQLFADSNNQKTLEESADTASLAGYLGALLQQAKRGDYFALLAYLERNVDHERTVQWIRHLVRDRLQIATCAEFGPRFLHSTGQLYKGGPNSGLFLQLTCEDAADLDVPGRRFTFGVVKAAQARGDLAVLAQRHRRALRVHLGRDVDQGLNTLLVATQHALAS